MSENNSLPGNALESAGFTSAHEVANMTSSQFVRDYAERLGEDGAAKAAALHARATDTHVRAMHLYANALSLGSAYARDLDVQHVASETFSEHFQELGLPSYDRLFGALNYCECEECKSIFGPAAYFVDLMRIIDQYVTRPNSEIPQQMTLAYRRNDLATLPLTCDNTNQSIPYLRIVNERLEALLAGLSGQNTDRLYSSLAMSYYPLNLPFNLPLTRIRIYLKRLGVSLAEVSAVMRVDGSANVAEQLEMSRELWIWLKGPTLAPPALLSCFGIDETSESIDVEKFTRQTHLSYVELKSLLYQDLSQSQDRDEVAAGLQRRFFINQGLDQPIGLDSNGISWPAGATLQALDHLHRFIRLARHLNWSFIELDWALICLSDGIPDINETALTRLAQFIRLKNQLGLSTEALGALVFALKTYGKDPQFDRVYNRAGVARPYRPRPDAGEGAKNPNPNPPLYTDDIVDYWKADTHDAWAARIAAGLGLQQADLDALAKALWPGKASLNLSVTNLSYLYQHTQMASLLKLPMPQYLKLRQVRGLDEPDITLDQIQFLVDDAAALRSVQMSVYELDYLVNGAASDFVDTSYTPASLKPWLDTLDEIVAGAQDTKTELVAQLAIFLKARSECIDGLLPLVSPGTDLAEVPLKPGPDLAVLMTLIKKLSRGLLFFNKLHLTLDELGSIAGHPASYGMKDFASLSVQNVLDIIRFKRLRAAYADTTHVLLDIMNAGDSHSALSRLADAVDQSPAALQRFDSDNRVDTLDRVDQFVTLLRKTGMDAQALGDLSGLIGQGWPSFSYLAMADRMLEVVQARFAHQGWKAVYEQIEGDVQEAKRQALLPLAVWKLGGQPETAWIQNPRQVYEYLLIDVEMSGCAQISYVKEALSAAQLYLQRCRQRLEAGVKQLDIPEVWWEWLLNYRRWEANRRIFLYPENYLDPVFRKSKTRLFKELENSLRQNVISPGSVQQAFTKYLDGFDELAHLNYVDAYYSNITDDTHADAPVLFLLARTYIQPYQYYYITRDQAGVWSEWNAIDLTIHAETATLIHVFDRLFVFWVEQKRRDEKAPDGSPRRTHQLSVKYSFVNFSGTWVQPQTLVDDLVVYVEGSDYYNAIKSFFPETLFDVDKLWYKKVYPIKVEKGAFLMPGVGANSTEKVLLFFGPLLSVGDYDLEVLLYPSAEPTSDSSDRADFERGLQKTIQNIQQAREHNVSGYIGLFPPLVLADNLEAAFLANPGEVLVLTDETDPYCQFEQLYHTDGGLFVMQSTANILGQNYLVDTNPAATQDVQSSNPVLFQDTHYNPYAFFTVKNHPRAYVVYGDQEYWLLIDEDPGLASLSRSLVNREAIFRPDDFIMPELNMGDIESEIFTILQTGGYLDAQGKLQPLADANSLTAFLTDHRDELVSLPNIVNVNTDPYFRAIVNKLMNRPVLKAEDFQIPAFQQFDPNPHTCEVIEGDILDSLRNSYGYLDINGRVDAQIDFGQLCNDLSGIASNISDQFLALESGEDEQANERRKSEVKEEEFQGQIVQSIFNVLDRAVSDPAASPVASIGTWPPAYPGQTSPGSLRAIRLTTGAVRRLSASLFTGGIDRLLSLSSQQMPVVAELPYSRLNMSDTWVVRPETLDGAQVDFSGPYGPYYWELFFHAPFYIANLLKANQHFQEAQNWYRYIFNPTLPPIFLQKESFMVSALGASAAGTVYDALTGQGYLDGDGCLTADFTPDADLSTCLAGLNSQQVEAVRNVLLNNRLGAPTGRFWQFLPLRNPTPEALSEQLQNPNEIDAYNDDPFDPHAIARLRIGAYEKAMVMQYVDNLLQWGDYYFTQYTWEALVTATMLYVYAYDLLGPRPENLGELPPSDVLTFESIQAKYKDDKDGIPQFYLQVEEKLHRSSLAMSFSPINALDMAFCVPENEQLIHVWDRVEDRLDKIRHCLNLQGIKQLLALFEPPVEAAQLARMAATGADVFSTLTAGAQVPYYRFVHLLERAKSMAGNVIQLGAMLLMALEKKDAEALARLQLTHQRALSNLTTQIKVKQIAELKASIDAFEQSRLGAQARYDHYKRLYDENLNALEITDLALRTASLRFQLSGTATRGISIAAYLLPNVFGLADGGMQFGEAVNAAAQIQENTGNMMDHIAGLISTGAQYVRRREEWGILRDSASYEVEGLKQQIVASQIQQSILERELEIHNTGLSQEQELEDFIKARFTNEELYTWMIGRLSTIYFQAYQLAVGMAMAAQNAYQNEMNTTDLILQLDYWDNLHRGLLAGEGLMLGLSQLENAYLQNDRRHLEIEKTISLLHLDPVKFIGFREGIHGATKGQLDFSLSEALYDFDFPGHYCRKIKAITVSIPAVVGPYQNINATLVQTNSQIVLQANQEAVHHLLNPDNKDIKVPGDSLKENWLPRQQERVALSRGINDAGLFVLDFRDERYLPFEGSGAVSDWTLSLPPETNRFDFRSISDILIKVQYTALDGGDIKDGGDTFANNVRALYKQQSPPYPYTVAKVFDLRQAFSGDWYKFINFPSSEDIQQISFKLTDPVILPNLNNIQLTKAAVMLITEQGVVVSDPDVSKPFIHLQIGQDSGAVSIEKNYGELPLTLTLDSKERPTSQSCALSLCRGDAPQSLLDPGVLSSIIVVIYYQSQIFGT